VDLLNVAHITAIEAGGSCSYRWQRLWFCAPTDQNIGPRRQQTFCDAPANAFAAAGDNCDLATEIKRVFHVQVFSVAC
jgi:hypothetical protein